MRTLIPGEAPRGRFGALWDSGGSGGGQTVQQTSRSEPPAYAAPALSDVVNKAGQIYNQNLGQPYPNATYTPASQASLQSIQGTIDTATGDRPLVPAAQAENLKMIQGGYLNPDTNPYLRGMVQSAIRPTTDAYTQQVVPGINASFAQNGRTGAGLNVLAQTQAGDTLLRNIGEQSNNLYGQAYGQERGFQNQAIAAAPGLADASYQDLAHLAQAGSAQEGYANQQLQDSIARWNAQQSQPWKNLANYAGIVQGGTVGGNTTQTIPTYQNPLMSGIGTGIAGLGALGSLFGRGGAFSGAFGF